MKLCSVVAAIVSSIVVSSSSSPFTAAFVPIVASSARRSSIVVQMSATDSIQGAQSMIDAIIDEKNCNPVFVRLAWHDSGTYDVNLKDEPWPKAGGAIGSIRFAPEITHGANKGLAGAVALLEPVKEKFPDLSYADIFQMASARAIELAGGPKIDMKYVPLYGCFIIVDDHSTVSSTPLNVLIVVLYFIISYILFLMASLFSHFISFKDTVAWMPRVQNSAVPKEICPMATPMPRASTVVPVVRHPRKTTPPMDTCAKSFIAWV